MPPSLHTVALLSISQREKVFPKKDFGLHLPTTSGDLSPLLSMPLGWTGTQPGPGRLLSPSMAMQGLVFRRLSLSPSTGGPHEWPSSGALHS